MEHTLMRKTEIMKDKLLNYILLVKMLKRKAKREKEEGYK